MTRTTESTCACTAGAKGECPRPCEPAAYEALNEAGEPYGIFSKVRPPAHQANRWRPLYGQPSGIVVAERDLWRRVAMERWVEIDRLRKRVEGLETAMKTIAANDFGLQGLMEDGSPTEEVVSYLVKVAAEKQQAARRSLKDGSDDACLCHCSGCGEAWNQRAEGLECPRCGRPAPDVRASAESFVEKHRDMLKRLADE